ncbi:MAG: glycosyltransferase family 2 protein [Planctomycetota bacterium]
MKLSLVLLTYNEIDGLRTLWDRIPFDAADEAFAVDGGSTDGTLEFYEERGFRVHEQKSRKGRGEAFRIAFSDARGDALLFYSPDGNEDPSDIARFREPLEAGADMVIASRMMKGAHNEEDGQFLKPRKWANNAFNFMANVTWNRGRYVTDTINGFRAITKEAWHTIRPDGPGYTIEYQSSIRAFKSRLKVIEFPTREGARIGGESYAHSIPTGLRFVRLYLREVLLGRRFALPGGRVEDVRA